MLVCAHCGSQHIVWDREYSPETGVTYRPRCFKCNRDKFEEVVKVELTNHEESTMGTYGKKCEAPGCEKRSWLKGLCHKHYIEKFGEYVPTKRGTGVTVPKKEKKAAIPETKLPVDETKQAGGETNQAEKGTIEIEFCIEEPCVVVPLAPELIDLLAKKAKEEYRTPKQHAAWLIDRGLQEGSNGRV